jgi:hypothetical protein
MAIMKMMCDVEALNNDDVMSFVTVGVSFPPGGF